MAAFVLGDRKEVIIALDWTDYDDDDHTTLSAYVVTTHGRATPLAWKTVKKSTLKGHRTAYEEEMIERLHAAIPTDVDIELLADRGFGGQRFYEMLTFYGWDYTIRFRGVIAVEYQGEMKPAKDWLPPSGRATKLERARVTRDLRHPLIFVQFSRASPPVVPPSGSRLRRAAPGPAWMPLPWPRLPSASAWPRGPPGPHSAHRAPASRRSPPRAGCRQRHERRDCAVSPLGGGHR